MNAFLPFRRILYGKDPTVLVGDHVVWVRATPESRLQGLVGIVQAVIPNKILGVEFDMYEIRFEFGTATLHGTQLELGPSFEAN